MRGRVLALAILVAAVLVSLETFTAFRAVHADHVALRRAERHPDPASVHGYVQAALRLGAEDDDEATLFRVAAVLERMGFADDRILVLERLVARRPESADLRFMLADALVDAGRFEAAAPHFALLVEEGDALGARAEVAP